MNGTILNELIVKINYEMRIARAKLEVEEKGREIASTQGYLCGYKELVSLLSSRFHLRQEMLEDNGEEPICVQDLSDETLYDVYRDMQEIAETEEWKSVLQSIQEQTEYLKNHLLMTADKTHDLDIAQGKHRGMCVYESVFYSFEHEVNRREQKKKEDKKAMPLFEDEEVEETGGRSVADRIIDFER